MSNSFETDPPDADNDSESRGRPAGEDGANAYKVGYRRPPKSSQFKKGQSGKPRGSSRKVQRRLRRQGLPLGDLVLENSQTLVRIREGNRTSRINVKDGMIRKLSALAFSGNRLALTAYLKMIQAAEKTSSPKFSITTRRTVTIKNNIRRGPRPAVIEVYPLLCPIPTTCTSMVTLTNLSSPVR
jgi:hypothetical protein